MNLFMFIPIFVPPNLLYIWKQNKKYTHEYIKHISKWSYSVIGHLFIWGGRIFFPTVHLYSCSSHVNRVETTSSNKMKIQFTILVLIRKGIWNI